MDTIYEAVVKLTGINPNAAWQANVEPPTKRARHKAGKLTNRVWTALAAGVDPATISPEDTQEIPIPSAIAEATTILPLVAGPTSATSSLTPVTA